MIGPEGDPRDRIANRQPFWDPRDDLPPLSELYADSGGDPSVCEFCEQPLDPSQEVTRTGARLPLDDSQEWIRGRDGAGAHLDCLNAYGAG